MSQAQPDLLDLFREIVQARQRIGRGKRRGGVAVRVGVLGIDESDLTGLGRPSPKLKSPEATRIRSPANSPLSSTSPRLTAGVTNR